MAAHTAVGGKEWFESASPAIKRGVTSRLPLALVSYTDIVKRLSHETLTLVIQVRIQVSVR